MRLGAGTHAEDIRGRLRRVTADAHLGLERTLNLLDETLDRTRYRAILERFFGFWRGWEPLAARLIADDTLFGERRRLVLLGEDLVTLGLPAEALETLAVCPPPPLRDRAEALGSLYVMEGSTLGGRVVLQHLEKRLGLTADIGCRYFAGYGARTGTMWRSFLTVLDEVEDEDADRVAAGALMTFECLEGWFER